MIIRARDIIQKREAEKQKFHQIPSEREKECKHPGGFPYSGKTPNTGPKKCRMCGMHEEDAKKASRRHRIAAELRKMARPPLGMPQEQPEMTSPGLENSFEEPGMDMEQEMAQEPAPEEGQQDDLPAMVRRISEDYLSDDKMGEIQKAIMGLMGHVPPESATDVAENFGKFMEAAFMLKADLQKLTIMGTPQNSLQQIQLFPEDEQQGLRSDVLT